MTPSPRRAMKPPIATRIVRLSAPILAALALLGVAIWGSANTQLPDTQPTPITSVSATPSSTTSPTASRTPTKSSTSSPTPQVVQKRPTFSKSVVATQYAETTVNKREEPTTSSPVKATVPSGSPVPLTSVRTQDGWRQTKDGSWVKEENLTSEKPSPKPSASPTETSEPSAEPSPTRTTRSRTNAPGVPYGVWDKLAQCESSGDWSINTGNGFYGGLQFTLSTWRAYGGTGLPHENSREEQIRVGKKVQAGQGWGAWPACAAKLGLL